MALENRSKPRQIVYLALAFAALVAVIYVLAAWNF
jgi:preprotein translocase subunit Sec61beta